MLDVGRAAIRNASTTGGRELRETCLTSSPLVDVDILRAGQEEIAMVEPGPDSACRAEVELTSAERVA